MSQIEFAEVNVVGLMQVSTLRFMYERLNFQACRDRKLGRQTKIVEAVLGGHLRVPDGGPLDFIESSANDCAQCGSSALDADCLLIELARTRRVVVALMAEVGDRAQEIAKREILR